MTTPWRRSIAGPLLALTFWAGPAAGQSPEPAPPPAAQSDAAEPTVTVPITPRDLARIRRALDTEPAVRINDDQLRFYMQILVKQPTFAEFIKGYDFKNGPTRRGNPMTHNEFLAMVTPKELAEFGGHHGARDPRVRSDELAGSDADQTGV